jgi:hypothetical protein
LKTFNIYLNVKETTTMRWKLVFEEEGECVSSETHSTPKLQPSKLLELLHKCNELQLRSFFYHSLVR